MEGRGSLPSAALHITAHSGGLARALSASFLSAGFAASATSARDAVARAADDPAAKRPG